MTQITIQLKDKEEETFVETFLKKMKIRFEKYNEDNIAAEEDFIFTDEMKSMVDERKSKNHKEFKPAREFLDKVKKDYGI